MNLTVREFSYRTTHGNAVGWIYQPAGTVRAAVQICHGMCEHMGRYHEFMRYLAKCGYAVCGTDHPGHGRTAGNNQLGFFASDEGGRLLLENQHIFYKIIQKELGCPVVMLGHSMGSFVARLFASRYPGALSGLILSGTGRAVPLLGAATLLAQRSIAKNGPQYVDCALDQFVFGLFNKPFEAEHPTKGWLSRDPEQVRRFCSDPLCTFTFSSSAIRDLLLLIRSSNQKDCFAHTDRNLPLLLFSGDTDPVGERGKGVRQVYGRYVAQGLTDVQIILYEGGRHEMLNEINRRQVYGDIRHWLDVHFPVLQSAFEFDPYEEWEG